MRIPNEEWWCIVISQFRLNFEIFFHKLQSKSWRCYLRWQCHAHNSFLDILLNLSINLFHIFDNHIHAEQFWKLSRRKREKLWPFTQYSRFFFKMQHFHIRCTNDKWCCIWWFTYPRLVSLHERYMIAWSAPLLHPRRKAAVEVEEFRRDRSSYLLCLHYSFKTRLTELDKLIRRRIIVQPDQRITTQEIMQYPLSMKDLFQPLYKKLPSHRPQFLK
jgi:hypothetical protein